MMKETFGATSGVGGDRVLEEIGAKATVSSDIKESVCNGEQNVIDPVRARILKGLGALGRLGLEGLLLFMYPNFIL